jgi:response regulator RpfG family c-di-GMP phosphodiesterase
MSGQDDETTVLAVDDDPDIVGLYEDYLGDDYRVVTATSGRSAIEQLTPEVDIVLLDRRMPETSGEHVLAAIEAREINPRVALVTAATPDVDIVDMRIDEYLIKPVKRTEIRETVERLRLIDEFTQRRQRLDALQVKRNVLAVEKSEAELAESEAYQRMKAEIDRLEQDVAELTESLDGVPLQRYC